MRNVSFYLFVLNLQRIFSKSFLKKFCSSKSFVVQKVSVSLQCQ